MKFFKNSTNKYYIHIYFYIGKSTLNAFYESYLHKSEDLDEFLADTSSQSIHTSTKVIKESILNSNHHSYGNLLWSHSITSTHNDDIVLVDTIENRLLFFNKEFIFKYQIGSKGNLDGEFDEPTDIIINEMGKLYVSDKNNYRLQIFSESKKNKDIKLNVSGGVDTKITALKKQPTKIFRASNEFNHLNSIQLDDKPIKLSSSPFNSVIAVSTENGLVFILNERNQIISYLKLKKPFEWMDLYTFCLNDFGTSLYVFRHYENSIKLCLYDTKLKNEDNNNEKNKMILKESIELDKNYLPGICLVRIAVVKLSLDLKHFLIYDALNINLLEYDLNGRFVRIIIKAEERLGNILSFDFSGDRQHIITSEIHFNKRNISTTNRTNKQLINISNIDLHQRNRSMANLFKLRIYKFMNCECHRNMNKRPTLNDLAKSNQMSQSFFLSNEQSLATFSKSNF